MGYDDWRDFVRDVSMVVPEHFADPDAMALMRDARAAGRKVGVLTNDGVAINGYDFFMRIPEFAALDAFVDASELGGGKPAPEPYLYAARVLNVEPARVVFLDDMVDCVEGAKAIGMNGVLVDPLAKRAAFAQARSLLGLPSVIVEP